MRRVLPTGPDPASHPTYIAIPSRKPGQRILQTIAGKGRSIFFLLSALACFAIFFPPIKHLVKVSLDANSDYSHILLIPFLAGFFFFTRRKSILQRVGYSPFSGLLVIGIGLLLGTMDYYVDVKNDHLPLMTFSLLVVLMGLFILFYGLQTFRKALFPLLFLLCMVPLPTFVLQHFQYVLWRGSVETISAIFQLLGLAVTREGHVFHFQTVNVEVLEWCSGIRPCVALMITTIMGSALILSKGWTRTIAVLMSIPIHILKNSLRIVVLSMVGAYIDEAAFDGPLHQREAGIFFFIFQLFVVWGVIMTLRKVENKYARAEVSRQSELGCEKE